MSREQVLPQLLKGGSGLTDNLPKLVRELAGLTPTIVAGVAAGSKMNIAAIREEDTILAALIPPAVVTNAVAESDSVAVSATGGVWNVIWGGVTSADLAWNISAANLKIAMELMSSIAPGYITSITGGPGDINGSAPYVITWNATLGNASALTTIATTLEGTKTAAVTPTNGTTQVSGTWLDDKANITIQSCKASGTLTTSDLPHNSDTFVVNGVTYTWKTLQADCLNGTYLKIPSSVALTCDLMASTVNAWESRYTGSKWNDPAVYATSNGATVVTFTSIREGAGNGPVIVGTQTTLAETTSDPAAPYLTCATVVADNTCVVNGVTFTAKAEPTGTVQFDVKLTDIAQAVEIARCLNNYAEVNGLDFVASTTGTAVVTVKPRNAHYGNIITLTENMTHTTKSGSGWLAGGTATGGIKSTTLLTGLSLFVFWYNKQ